MTVFPEPFASVYDDRSRPGSGFKAYAADDRSMGLFPSPRKAAAAITMTRSWVAQKTRPGQAYDGAQCDPIKHGPIVRSVSATMSAITPRNRSGLAIELLTVPSRAFSIQQTRGRRGDRI